MAKSTKSSYQIIAFAVVLLIATFLRFYRISELTEFLGDQGRTGIHIYEAWQNKKLPLVGPTVLSGQHLGPAFYYLIAPSFILTGFNPLAPAVFTVLLGVGAVGLLWWLGREFFGWQVATMLAALWAVSPQIVSSDRVLWEPNMIPFFVFLYLTALYKKWGIVTGIALGILVQLHYPNLIFVGMTLIYYCFLWKERKTETQEFVKFSIITVLGFIIAVLPFLIYESSHRFEDIAGVIRNFFESGGVPLAKRQILANILDYSSRVIRRASPIPVGWEALAIAITIIVSTLKPTFWKVFICLWFILGIVTMSLYRGVVFDHYLFFLLPAVFLVFGNLLWWLQKKTHRFIPIVIVLLLTVIHIRKSDIFHPANNDISRTSAIVREIEGLSEGQPFSFGLISSRSFSDLHYRYFFLIKSLHPQPITSDAYQRLFLTCETASCPTSDDLLKLGKVQILCYDPSCNGEYPKITLKSWKLLRVSDIQSARLYQYQQESVK